MGAGQDGTGAQSSFGFRERVSETATRKDRPLEGRSRPRGAREAADSMEKCLLAPHCRERHRPTACEKFKGLSLQHRQSIIAEQELCANCLRHSDLDTSKRRDCIERAAEPHWVGSSVRRPRRTPSPEREMPTPVEPETGKARHSCRMDIMARTKSDLRKEEYGASLSVLFSASRQMTAVVQSVAVEKGLPWRTVPEVTVMLGDGRRETSTKLLFIEIKAYRTHQSGKEPNPILIAAYGVRDLAPVATAAPELPLLRHRFPDTSPVLTMGMLAQKEGPINLLIGRDYRKQWPVVISSSCFDSDRLMKSTFHPGQLLYGLANRDAVGTKMKGVKRRLTLGKGESAGSSTSSSRRHWAATPAADSPGRRRRESPSPIRRVREKSDESPSPIRRVREKSEESPSPIRRVREKSEESPLPVRRARKRSRGPPSRSTSAASSTEGRQQDRSVSSRRDREDRSVKRKEKESLAREAPAKKRRTRVLSSSSSSSSGSDVVTISSSDDFLHSSSSEDEAVAEIRIVDEEEEKQLRMLGE
jgi:hypothetical protein